MLEYYSEIIKNMKLSSVLTQKFLHEKVCPQFASLFSDSLFKWTSFKENVNAGCCFTSPLAKSNATNDSQIHVTQKFKS